MNTPPIAPLFARIVDDLATHGWSQQAIFIPTDLTAELAKECHRRAQRGQLEPAGIGRGRATIVHENIRGDRIQWLDAGHHAAVDRYLGLMEQLRSAINHCRSNGSITVIHWFRGSPCQKRVCITP